MGKAPRMDSWEIVSGVAIPQARQMQWFSLIVVSSLAQRTADSE